MSAQSDENEHHEEVQRDLAELVRRSLIQLSDMENVNERLHSLGEKLSKITQYERPHAPERDDDQQQDRQAG